MTVTVDPELVEAANRAVSNGEAESVSGWVSAALIDKVAKDHVAAQLMAVSELVGEHAAAIVPVSAAASSRARSTPALR